MVMQALKPGTKMAGNFSRLISEPGDKRPYQFGRLDRLLSWDRRRRPGALNAKSMLTR